MWELLDKRMKGKQNSNWLKENKDNINRNWRPISFKAEFEKILNTEWTLKIPKENIHSVNEDWSITIKMAKKDAIVMKALWWAMSNKWSEATKMLIWIMEMFDWKAKQTIDQTSKLEFENEVSKEEQELINKALWKNMI